MEERYPRETAIYAKVFQSINFQEMGLIVIFKKYRGFSTKGKLSDG